MIFTLTVVLVICFGVICYVDFRWFVIPDSINIVLLLAGLTFRLQQGVVETFAACVFALLVGLLMWTIRQVHLKLTGRVGLGLGDVKLAGAAAVWFSPWMFPIFLFLASSLALVFLLVFSLARKEVQTQKVPFGPFLAGSLIVTWNLERLYGSLIGQIS
ncbi:peptidase A24A prepilin type IV [Rhizobium sp. CF080]|uniref:prepilin peptidase n=1 Tax=Rhizobium sp. (strain CF080) TaxID=1144310 RepID=UPI0002717004|nr:A24 family peptidase [Rhizobium sp. CF080]EUB98381.1 peptidase A24A prepilin type IV [Rhizobium sp. CF080]